MKLKLSLTSIDNNTSDELSSITLDKTTATLGRQVDNVLVLKDAQRFISAHHAKIDYRSPDYYLTDTSTNGVYINQSITPLGKGNSIKLSEGDQIHIGDYTISVTFKDEINESSLIQSTKPSDSINYDLLDDPFGEITSDPIQGMIDENEILPTGWADNKETANDPFDFSADYSAVEENSEKNELDQIPAHRQAFEPYLKKQDTTPVDEKISTESNQDDIFSENWFIEDKLEDNKTEKVTDIHHNTLESKPFSQTNDIPVNFNTTEKPEINSETINKTHSETESERDLIDYFLRGADLNDHDFAKAMTPETFFIIGTILRASIHGAMDVLSSRAKIKQEMHIDMTMIRPKENNPIKFSISPEEALTKLLTPHDAGYLPPVEAVNEVFNDIRAHQLSVIAGMQKALLSVLNRFDPVKLEKLFLQQNPIGASIPLRKQAKLWSMFEQLYKDIEQEAKDDFYHLFGQVFAETYEKQNKLLTSDKEKQPFD